MSATNVQEVRDELVLVRASLPLPDEFGWESMSEEAMAFWTENDSSLPSIEAIERLAFQVKISSSPQLFLRVEYPPECGLKPNCSIHSLEISSKDQMHLVEIMKEHMKETVGSEMPAFEVITFMQDYISTYQFESDLPSKKTTELQSLMSTTRNRKFVIIWAHHLLATSKRKDIIKWSEELDLAGISKPGYPGIIIVQGPERNVNEFVRSLKALNWQALQIRFESIDTSIPDLGPVLSRSDHGQRSAVWKEYESISEVSKIMEEISMKDAFLDALKIGHD